MFGLQAFNKEKPLIINTEAKRSLVKLAIKPTRTHSIAKAER